MSEHQGLLDLSGKNALVTGGSGGIGKAVCKQLLAANCSVYSLDRPGLASPDGSIPLECDLGDEEATRSFANGFCQQPGKLDILVCAAGITRDRSLSKLDPKDWKKVQRINLESVFDLLQVFTPLLRESAQASVVLLSSINAQRGKFGQGNYASSKAGLIGLGKSAAKEMGRYGCRVNIIAPGFIETPMTENLDQVFRDAAIAETVLAKAGQPEDIAHAVHFLCSSMSTHISGQVLRVDGGQLIA